MQRTFSPADTSADAPSSFDSLYVSDAASLQALAERLEPALASDPRLAFDTEFIRERTYKPVLEIVQVATSGGFVAIVDVPALKGEWGILRDLFLDANVLKILHAGGQDMEILTMVLGETPASVFDTQVAAAFTGYSLQTGYGALVQAVLQVKLAKDEGFADWSRRPLTAAMREYAENDVRYLHALHDKMTTLLEKARAHVMGNRADEPGRFSPVFPLCRRPNYGARSVAKMCWIGGGLAVLRELTAWRDSRKHMRRDKPRRSVVKDDFLIELSRRAPVDASAILGLRSAPQNLGEKNAQALAEVVKRAVLPCRRMNRPGNRVHAEPLDEQGAVLAGNAEHRGAACGRRRRACPRRSLRPATIYAPLPRSAAHPTFDGALFSGLARRTGRRYRFAPCSKDAFPSVTTPSVAASCYVRTAIRNKWSTGPPFGTKRLFFMA